jgi:hypothetical protein
VPTELPPGMRAAFRAGGVLLPEPVWTAVLAAAPEPPHVTMTAEEARTFQGWAGMDGATAFWLIERHANGWGDVARMMAAWLDANRAPNDQHKGPPQAVPLDAPVRL